MNELSSHSLICGHVKKRNMSGIRGEEEDEVLDLPKLETVSVLVSKTSVLYLAKYLL